MAAAEPTLFFNNLHVFGQNLEELTVHCANPNQDYPCFSPSSHGKGWEFEVMFLTKAVQKEQGASRLHYVPQHLSQWSRNLLSQGPVDVFWGSCSRPNSQGFVSLGTGCCYESEILRKASVVILEVNANMPFVHGDHLIQASQVTHFLDNTHPLPTLVHARFSPEDRLVAQQVCALISSESTLQLGIGGIPDALSDFLLDKSNLGIHTEIITDTMMQLMQKGIVTNAKKTLYPGQTVGSFVFGSEELYKFINNNKNIKLLPSSFVNSSAALRQNPGMTSVNTAVEVDLTGQVCSESVGHREISGVGGAFDTHFGAQQAPGGQGIIALRAASPDLSYSKIVFELRPGAKISISRNDVDTVVTEYGVARLKGLSVAKRARALIAVAHPQFRDELLKNAKDFGYI
jgi:acyl-CoA hydrolase